MFMGLLPELKKNMKVCYLSVCAEPGSGTLSAAKAAAIFVPVAAVVAGGVAAVVVTLLVLNHRRQVCSPFWACQQWLGCVPE